MAIPLYQTVEQLESTSSILTPAYVGMKTIDLSKRELYIAQPDYWAPEHQITDVRHKKPPSFLLSRVVRVVIEGDLSKGVHRSDVVSPGCRVGLLWYMYPIIAEAWFDHFKLIETTPESDYWWIIVLPQPTEEDMGNFRAWMKDKDFRDNIDAINECLPYGKEQRVAERIFISTQAHFDTRRGLPYMKQEFEAQLVYEYPFSHLPPLPLDVCPQSTDRYERHEFSPMSQRCEKTGKPICNLCGKPIMVEREDANVVYSSYDMDEPIRRRAEQQGWIWDISTNQWRYPNIREVRVVAGDCEWKSLPPESKPKPEPWVTRGK